MSLPSTYEEWQKQGRAWRRRARQLVGEVERLGPRSRPRDADEARALRELGLDDARPFAGLHDSQHPANLIRRARENAKVTQAELAARLGMKQQQIQRLENARHSNPTWETIAAVATALGKRARVVFE